MLTLSLRNFFLSNIWTLSRPASEKIPVWCLQSAKTCHIILDLSKGFHIFT